eukprot:INCI9136.1.p1 GENE.INCI9136.1~~INCI9136.1.p1  ORF type:complete len:750 (+),score=148.49 INCI9136.1:176-2425(+)
MSGYYHQQAARKSVEWFDNSPAAIKRLQSNVSYSDLEHGGVQARDTDALDDTAVLEKDLSRLVPETVSDPALRALLFGETPTEESVAQAIRAIRDTVQRFLKIRLRPGYAQGMHMVVALLLAKMRPEKALWVFVAIVEDIMPIDFYSKPPAAMQGFRVETELIVRLTVLMFPEMNDFGEDVDDSNLSVAVRMLSAKILVPLFVDVCSLEVTEAIWDRLLAGGKKGADGDKADGHGSLVGGSEASSGVVDTSVGVAGAAIFVHIVLAIVAEARPKMDPQMRSTAIYQLLLDTVAGLTAEDLPRVLGAVDGAFVDPHVLKKYRVKARQQLSARWIEKPDRLRKMVRRDDVHFGLGLLEKLRETFSSVSEQTGVIGKNMLRKVLRKATEEGQVLPLPLDMFCDGVVRLHATSDEGLAVLGKQRAASTTTPSPQGNGALSVSTGDDGRRHGRATSASSPSDSASDSSLDFRELVSVLSIALRGTFAQKLRLCFDIFNPTASGYLTIDEAERMVRAILRVPSAEEEAEEERIAEQTNYVPPSFDDRHAAVFFPQARIEADAKARAKASAQAVREDKAQALRSCVSRCIDALRDIAENTTDQFASPDMQAQSRHALACFTFSEVYDAIASESLLRDALGFATSGDGRDVGSLTGGVGVGSGAPGEGGGDGASASPPRRFATDSIIVRSVKAASPRRRSTRRSARTVGHSVGSNGSSASSSGRPTWDTALIESDEATTVSHQPPVVSKCKDCCVIS